MSSRSQSFCLSNTDLGNTLTGILPKHTHWYTKPYSGTSQYGGYGTGMVSWDSGYATDDGHIASSVQNVSLGDTLRPPAIAVAFWQRTA